MFLPSDQSTPEGGGPDPTAAGAEPDKCSASLCPEDSDGLNLEGMPRDRSGQVMASLHGFGLGRFSRAIQDLGTWAVPLPVRDISAHASWVERERNSLDIAFDTTPRRLRRAGKGTR